MDGARHLPAGAVAHVSAVSALLAKLDDFGPQAA
jgi:hypothetical protein